MKPESRRPATMRARLLLTYLTVVAVGMVALFIAVRLSAPSFFDHHISGMGSMQGPGGGMMADEGEQLDDALTRSLNEGFLIAAGVALPLALIASFVVARQVSAPVRRLADASSRIAHGQYAGRVAAGGPRELEELAQSFNAMAGALEQAERRRMQLVGDVAHELRTPIAVLRGYLEGLADGVVPASEETWSRLHDETGRLGRLVEDLQELSRAEAGQLSVSVSPVSPAAAIEAAATRLETAFAEKGLELQVRPMEPLPQVSADFDRLVQVLSNLLGNALSYTPSPGTVTVAARRAGETVEFSVRDTGIGIAPNDLPHVFERFYRVDRSRARASGGSGVGLTIANALIEAMGGTIRAESEGEGHGATFTFHLPLSG